MFIRSIFIRYIFKQDRNEYNDCEIFHKMIDR